METYSELKARMKSQYGLTVAEKTAEILPPATEVLEKAFVISPPNSDKLYLTGRVTHGQQTVGANRAFSYIKGRYAQADKANLNGALFSTADIEFGLPTVCNSPANLLHEEDRIVGCITEASIVQNDPQFGTHLVTGATLWRYLFPREVDVIEHASKEGKLFQSMEAVAEQIQCVGHCEELFDYQTFMKDKSSACEALGKGGVRRLVNPTFLATGILFGGVMPGWSDAKVETVKAAAEIAETNHLETGTMSREEAESLVQNVLRWANREA